MAWDVGKNIVLPGASGILGGIFGGGAKPYPNDLEQMVDLGANAFGPGGGLPVAGGTWNAGIGGKFIAPNHQAYEGALNGFYGADPNESAYGRFADWDESWNRFFDTSATGPNGEFMASPMQSTGFRTQQGFGGREGFAGGPVAPQQTDLWKGLTGTAGFYNADPYMTPGRSVDDLTGMSQWRIEDPYLDPEFAAGGIESMARNRGPNRDPYQLSQRGVEGTRRLTNQYEDDLMRSIDEEAQRSLAIQFPEVRQQAQMLGLTEGAAAERMGGDVARDVLGQAAREKAGQLAQFRESGMGRISDAINLRSQLGAQGGMQELELGAGAYGQGMGQRGQALGDVYGTSAGLLGQAQSDRQATMRAQQESMYRGLSAADQSVLQRLGMESQEQSRGMQDYMGLIGQREDWRTGRLNEMLSLADRERAIEQERLNQQMQFGMMPMDWLMQLATGVQTGGRPTGGSTTPWWQGLIGAGAQAGGNMLASYLQEPQPSVFDVYGSGDK